MNKLILKIGWPGALLLLIGALFLGVYTIINQSILDEEKKVPVSRAISPEEMHNTIDLSLEYDPLSEEDFKKSLRRILLKSPKSSVCNSSII